MSLVVGVVGLTHPHSTMHLRTLDVLKRVNGIVLCDPDPSAVATTAAQRSKVVDTVGNVGDLLTRRDVSVVLITLPNAVTPRTIVRAADAGKHVLCEKPCARSSAELRPAIEAVRRNNVKFMAFYVWRANPAVLKLRALVRQGAIGRLTSAELRMVTTQVALRDPTHWLFRRDQAGGGIATWLGCHWLDLLRFTTNQEVDEVAALTANVGGEAIDVEDVASASLRLSGGGIVSFYAGYVLAHGQPGYSGADYDSAFILRGTEGNLAMVDEDGAETVVYERAAPTASVGREVFHFPAVPSPAYGGGPGLDFVNGFLDAATSGIGDGPCSIQEAARVLEILDAIYASAGSGCLTRVDRRADAD
jgi:UDP-N-acetyl-2-amino-2-deoxyglucuronate dehydrogenase